MQVTINGEIKSLGSVDSLAELLLQLGYTGETFAVALNGDFVARADYSRVKIGEGDCLDVVAPVVGG
ncbi:sulfur carrier protein ThiS [Microbulbifer hainanensis]|uniref:sulfur carrier protein ThiS n=1 Tax=Microbulbifer hainanensis TaxID=2735675 RepID=UPI00186819C3|nr:sulfur carrier protein ThiS [Microbulbifer hainanensis]